MAVEEILAGGVHTFAETLVRELELLGSDIEDAYFPRLPVAALVEE